MNEIKKDDKITDVKCVYTTGNLAPSGEVFEKKHLDQFIKKQKEIKK